jgi:hypothetical protein
MQLAFPVYLSGACFLIHTTVNGVLLAERELKQDALQAVTFQSPRGFEIIFIHSKTTNLYPGRG